MAIFRFEAKLIKRPAGRSIVAAAAYRAGALLTDLRTGDTADYTRRQGVIHTEIIGPLDAPKWTSDRSRLWNAVEVVEKRRDAQLGREIIMALPHELGAGEQINLVHRFVRSAFVAKGMVADIAIHRPIPPADSRNVHAHILLTLRRVNEQGFGPKERAWNERGLLSSWRDDWARDVNLALVAAGIDEKIDHRAKHAPRRQINARRGRSRDRLQHILQRRWRSAGRRLAALPIVMLKDASEIFADVEPLQRER